MEEDDNSFLNSIYANVILAVAFGVYKVLERCMQSKCKYTRDEGLNFDLGDADCPANDMDQISKLLRQRSILYKNKTKENETVPKPDQNLLKGAREDA